MSLGSQQEGDTEMTTWHVAVKGNNRWSGTKAEANARAGDGPFATLARARDAVREWRRGGGTGPAEVVIGGGTYSLNESPWCWGRKIRARRTRR
jgi:hypothetical protein